MSIKANHFYNDPAMAQAAANLSDLFAPPSGSDASGYATARGKDLETNQRQAMWDYMQRPGADKSLLDRAGVIADLYDPSQSYYAVDTAATTSRSNNEADNIRAEATNASDNKRALLQTLYGNLGRGDVRPAVDPQVAAQYGIPAMPRQQGLPVPLSETEVKGGLLADLAAGNTGGIVDPDVVRQALLGTEVTPTVDAAGNPVNTPRYAAAGTTPVLSAEQQQGQIIAGLTPEQQIQKVLGTDVVQIVDPVTHDLKYVNRYDAAGQTPVPGTAPATDTFTRKDGSTFVGFADAQGQVHNQATRALEPDAVRKGAPSADTDKLQVDDFIAVGADGKEKRFVGYFDPADRKIHDQGTGAVVPDVVQKGIGTGGLSIKTNPDGTVEVTQGGAAGGRPTAEQARANYVDIQSRPAAQALMKAYDTGALPDEGDYYIQNSLDMADQMDPGVSKFFTQVLGEKFGRTRMSPAGQEFYSNIQTLLPLQLLIQSGAAVNEGEAQRKRNELTPRPSDTAQVKLNRRNKLQLYLTGLEQWANGKIDKVNVPEGVTGAELAATPPAAAATAAPAATTAPAATAPGPNDTILEFDAQGNLKK